MTESAADRIPDRPSLAALRKEGEGDVREARGKRRIHAKPSWSEQMAGRLATEL